MLHQDIQIILRSDVIVLHLLVLIHENSSSQYGQFASFKIHVRIKDFMTSDKLLTYKSAAIINIAIMEV